MAGPGGLAGQQIELEIGHLQSGGGGALVTSPPEVLDAGQQLREGIGFGQVIVAAGAQPLDPIVDLAQRGQEQHRRRIAGLAQVLHQAQPVEVRQHAIDDQPIERLHGGTQQPLTAVLRDLGAVPALPQTFGEVLRGVAIVFDDQDTHGSDLGFPHADARVSRPSGLCLEGGKRFAQTGTLGVARRRSHSTAVASRSPRPQAASLRPHAAQY